jgi:C-terminal processing protease CtpA/Prc
MTAGRVTGLMLSALLVLAPCVTQAADERGFFGFQVNVETDGPALSPVLRSITIQKIFAGSPAAKNGIAISDQIVEIDGVAVAGRKAGELEPVMRKTVGQALRVKLKRKNGELYSTELVAIPRPADLP